MNCQPTVKFNTTPVLHELGLNITFLDGNLLAWVKLLAGCKPLGNGSPRMVPKMT